ncbi:MAG: PD-(D/E)XK nuclease family protein, partial [Actinomycetota bacterium]
TYSELPYGVREDSDHLPLPWVAGADGKRVPKKKEAFAKELKQRAVEDERRLFYVALTRAKQRLYVTASWWYERHTKERGPSIFFDEVQACDCTENLGEADRPLESPLAAQLQARAVWPPAAAEPPIYPEINQGYPRALAGLLSSTISPDDLLAQLDEGAKADAIGKLKEHRRTLAAIRTLTPAGPADSAAPSMSVTTAVTAVDGPETAGAPLARLELPSEARRIGIEVHRWIEEQARGLTGLADDEALDVPAAGVAPSKIAALKKAFGESGYESRRIARLDSGEPMAEVPFVLKLGKILVRGRIDAVYTTDEGGLEIVDFKTGGKVQTPEVDQLIIYAAALVKLGIQPAGDMTLTYCYLATGEKASRTVSAAMALEALDHLKASLG